MTQPPSPPKPSRRKRPFWLPASVMAAVAALMSACRPPTAPTRPEEALPASSETPAVVGPVPSETGSARTSAAATPRAYRQDAATHLYGLNADRIHKGKLPPLLYAIGVLEVDIDKAGRVTAVRWLRAPRHAPEVMKEIERMVREAAPFPAPARMGKVTYTDTWLWDKSGRFQLDTKTEGQL
ncbi:energy transducer TonB [Acidovorax sp. Leaf160]|uniref:energy transducer TonB n=1 Tax=Acidovorax sp. Leaf160 TaxID=1736280 RepID=UPI000A6FCE3B